MKTDITKLNNSSDESSSYYLNVKFIKGKSNAKYTNLGRGEVLAISALEVYRVVQIGLQEDPWFLVNAEEGDNTVVIDTKCRG